MTQYDGRVLIDTQINTKNASAQLMSLENRIVKTADKIAGLRSKMDALRDVEIPTQEYKDIESDIARAEKEMQKLIEKQAQMQIEGKNNGAAWDTLNQKIQASKDYIDLAKEDMQQLVDTGKAFTLGQDTEEYAKLSQQLQYAENDLVVLNKRHSELISKQKDASNGFKKLGSSAKKVFSKINSIVSKTVSSIKKFGSFLKKAFSGSNKSISSTGLSLKNILKYGFGIRSLYTLFSKLRSAIKEGYENLYNDNERFKNSVDSLKASALTLKNSFAAAFRPLVDMAIPYIQKVIDYMSELLNYVGQFIAALTGQKTYTKAIRQTANAFKDAKKAAEGYLSPLDEINKYQTSKSADAESATGVMFEEVPIETKFENIADWFKKMWENADFTELGALLGQKLRDALNNIPWKDIKEKGKKIGKSLATLINGFVEAEGLSESIGKTIGESINTGVSTAKSFIENTHFYEIGKFVAETANSAMKTTEWGELAETISLGIEGALDTAIGFLDNFDWDEFTQSIEEFLAGIDWGGILGRLGLIILEVFRGVFSIGNKLGVDLTSSLAEFFRSIGWDSVAGFFEGLSERIEFYGKAGKLGFEKIIEWVKDLLGIHSPSTVFAEIGKNVVEGFINGLSDLKDKVVEVFNQTKEAAKKPINAIISLVETLANSVIEGINVVIAALNNLSFDIPDWIPGIGGESLGFNIPEFSKISIPRLATGTVVPPNREFMAVLGDNKREPEVVSPISTIEQAVENVMSRMGGIGGNGNLTLKVYLEDSQLLNPKKIFEAVITEGKVQQMSSGKNRLLLEN